MDPRSEKPSKIKRLFFLPALVVAGLLLLYSVAGFWLLPRMLQSRLPGLIAAQLPVTATVGKIGLNPFTLTASIRDLTVKGNEGEHLFGFKELFANLQLASVFRKAVIVKEVRLTGPDALLQVLPDGRFNLLTVLPPPDDSSDANEDPPTRPPRIVVERFVLEGGTLVFRDRSSKTPL